MAKHVKPPAGFLSAASAIKRLGTSSSTFYSWVDQQKISRVIPPGYTEGYYPEAQINEIKRARDAFDLLALTDSLIFSQAQEEDIVGITHLAEELFGKGKTADQKTRLAQYRANPLIFHILKQNEIIVGYIGLFPLRHEAIEAIMSGISEDHFRTGILSPDNIEPYAVGQGYELFLVIGAKQLTNEKKQIVIRSRVYGARLISGAIGVIENLARKNIMVSKVYATSRTHDGLKLCHDMGFTKIEPEGEEDDLSQFELDVLSSANPLFSKYQRILERKKKLGMWISPG